MAYTPIRSQNPAFHSDFLPAVTPDLLILLRSFLSEASRLAARSMVFHNLRPLLPSLASLCLLRWGVVRVKANKRKEGSSLRKSQGFIKALRSAETLGEKQRPFLCTRVIYWRCGMKKKKREHTKHTPQIHKGCLEADNQLPGNAFSLAEC